MATGKNRQRALARAKFDRQIARRTAAARKRRQSQAAVGVGLVIVLVIAGVITFTDSWSTLLHGKPKITAQDCTWNQYNTGANVDLTDVGTPPTTGIPRSGIETMTITTDQGPIVAQLDLTRAPCAAANFRYLASRQYYLGADGAGTACHRLSTQGLYMLQCGDPSGSGAGGPTYRFNDEFRPVPTPEAQPSTAEASPSPTTAPSPTSPPTTALYPRGTLAMANSGPNTNGSQFFIVYKDSRLLPNYTIVGTVTSGLEVVERVAAAGVQDNAGAPATDGKPKSPIKITALTVNSPPAAPASPSTGPSSTPPSEPATSAAPTS